MVTKHRESFSAVKIQDFMDCERRYELKYILEQSWPSISSEPIAEIEENIRKGNEFHFLIFQFFSGIPKDKLICSIEDAEIQKWFNSFLDFSKNIDPKKTFPEFHIVSQLNDLRLTAVFDLVYISENNKVRIFDWKTSRFIPKKATLSSKVQTILYPYLIYETYREFLPKINLVPEDISMQYWYPAAPNEEYLFKYGKSIHENHHIFLENTLNEICNKNIGEYALTNNKTKCGFCSYRSLCDRGTYAASYLDLMDTEIEGNDFSIDFNQLPEIPFDE
jgi:hypothetical protein